MNMRSKMQTGAIFVALAAGAAMFGAADPATPQTSGASAPANGITATLADASFLKGCWQGSMGADSFVEETWSEPNGRNCIGMFRWNKPDGNASVFELLTIQEENGTLLLRLRHHSAQGVAWEEKEKPMVFALAEKTPTMLRFDAFRDAGDVARCRYSERDGKLNIDVEFAAPTPAAVEAGKKQRKPLNFELSRKPL
ncbi:MAG: hypothetical protein KF691_14535 [Phycisphaeraceae bacterium]|nr:hypothetical protein [Phycisphaeraceae bacterium]